MAIQNHEVDENSCPLDISTIVKYIELINDQAQLVSPLTFIELKKKCLEIVTNLAEVEPQNVTWVVLQVVEQFLLLVVNSIDAEERQELIMALIGKLYTLTSDPQCQASPVTAVVLAVFNTDVETSQATARWLVQQSEVNGGIHASLTCLYSWMFQWDESPDLADWVLSVIKALEEKERFDVLIDVSLSNLSNLVSTMDYPSNIRRATAEVILHVLASLRECKEALVVVAPHVDRVLTELASDSGQFSRQLLQNMVDILSYMINRLNNNEKDNYAEVVVCLQEHMASRGCSYLQLEPWRSNSNKMAPPKPLVKKVGLANLGNTCYMNSIMQALLLTRQFSTSVMMRMINRPYWAIMSILFAKMNHSICPRISPQDFYEACKPPFFSSNKQHDSSEFLNYLFQLLHSYEHRSDRNFDYSKPPVLTTATRCLRNYQSTPSDAESSESLEALTPSSSSSGFSATSSGGVKRQNLNDNYGPSKKRSRVSERMLGNEWANICRISFIDNMFGGILVTKMECTECHGASRSYDIFRDLQLAFPDKHDEFQHSVQSLIDYYCSKETMTGDNQYYCRDCGRRQDAERSVLIEATPKYLILVLKNFKYDPKVLQHAKLMHNVFHNHNVTLPTVRPQGALSSYSLYAAVIHTGRTLDSGHYYTLAKDVDTWYNFNDEEVIITNDQEINKLPQRCFTPYVLFYKRADIDEGEAPVLSDLPPKLQESVLAHNKPYSCPPTVVIDD